MTNIGPIGGSAAPSATAGAAGATTILSAATPSGAELYPGTVIIATTQDSGVDASGQYVDGRTVTFQLATGDIGSVWVPYASLTAANVAALINARALELAAVWELNNPS